MFRFFSGGFNANKENIRTSIFYTESGLYGHCIVFNISKRISVPLKRVNSPKSNDDRSSSFFPTTSRD